MSIITVTDENGLPLTESSSFDPTASASASGPANMLMMSSGSFESSYDSSFHQNPYHHHTQQLPSLDAHPHNDENLLLNPGGTLDPNSARSVTSGENTSRAGRSVRLLSTSTSVATGRKRSISASPFVAVPPANWSPPNTGQWCESGGVHLRSPFRPKNKPLILRPVSNVPGSITSPSSPLESARTPRSGRQSARQEKASPPPPEQGNLAHLCFPMQLPARALPPNPSGIEMSARSNRSARGGGGALASARGEPSEPAGRRETLGVTRINGGRLSTSRTGDTTLTSPSATVVTTVTMNLPSGAPKLDDGGAEAMTSPIVSYRPKKSFAVPKLTDHANQSRCSTPATTPFSLGKYKRPSPSGTPVLASLHGRTPPGGMGGAQRGFGGELLSLPSTPLEGKRAATPVKSQTPEVRLPRPTPKRARQAPVLSIFDRSVVHVAKTHDRTNYSVIVERLDAMLRHDQERQLHFLNARQRHLTEAKLLSRVYMRNRPIVDDGGSSNDPLLVRKEQVSNFEAIDATLKGYAVDFKSLFESSADAPLSPEKAASLGRLRSLLNAAEAGSPMKSSRMKTSRLKSSRGGGLQHGIELMGGPLSAVYAPMGTEDESSSSSSPSDSDTEDDDASGAGGEGDAPQPSGSPTSTVILDQITLPHNKAAHSKETHGPAKTQGAQNPQISVSSSQSQMLRFASSASASALTLPTIPHLPVSPTNSSAPPQSPSVFSDQSPSNFSENETFSPIESPDLSPQKPGGEPIDQEQTETVFEEQQQKDPNQVWGEQLQQCLVAFSNLAPNEDDGGGVDPSVQKKI